MEEQEYVDELSTILESFKITNDNEVMHIETDKIINLFLMEYHPSISRLYNEMQRHFWYA